MLRTLALIALACGACVFMWSGFLSLQRPVRQVRSALLAVLAAATAAELSLCLTGQLHWWMVAVVGMVNAWGPLDAVLRYPAVHDVDTVFTVKQVVLLCGKLVSFPFGLVDLLGNCRILLALAALNFCVLPLIYLVALPLDRTPEEQRRAAEGVDDSDVALRLLRLAVDPKKRQACTKALRRRIVPAKTISQLPLWARASRGGC